jgi:hypothetical protein
MNNKVISKGICSTAVHGGGFVTAILVNPPERELAKYTSVQCVQLLIYMQANLPYFLPISYQNDRNNV